MRSLRQISSSLYPILSFLLLILIGAIVLLALPTRDGAHISIIDALFMATSATCVTGLSVIDIGAQFSIWGQLTILVLIQLGGLGIMTFSTVLLLALGRSISFRSRFVVQDVLTSSPQEDLYTLLRHVVIFTFSLEAAATMVLFLRFLGQFEPPEAFYYALFHSISAFCNAGFSLFSDSLMSYRSDLVINSVIVVLIIMGGIGFLVLHEAVRDIGKPLSWSRFWKEMSLHSKIVIWMTSILLAGGTFFLLISEWAYSLKGFPFWEKVLASLFQSVTPRTAGFNTLDIASLNNVTLLGIILLMFIGASPGSCGGGVKTSSLGVLLALNRSRLSGSSQVHAFKRSIPSSTIDRAFGIFVISVMIVIIGTALLLITESGDLPLKAGRGAFLELLFETASAFGTVGLSMGVTSSLTSWGKLILVLIMFTGRLGPLVIAMAIQSAPGRAQFRYAEERVMIG